MSGTNQNQHQRQDNDHRVNPTQQELRARGSHRARRALVGTTLVVLTVGGLVACGTKVPKADSGDRSSVTSTSAPSTTVAASDTSTAATSGGTSTGGNTGGNTGGGNTGGGNTGGNTGGGNTGGGNGTPTSTAPTVTSFTTPESIDCHNGSFQTFTASWTTQGATKVTISIDGPGIYDTYGPNDSVSLPFNCSTSHTFLLTAFAADGTTTTKQITLQPRNVPSGGNDTSMP